MHFRRTQAGKIPQKKHYEIYKQKLHIHHINYNKLLSIKENCITLCIRCNSLVNKDREYWEDHFQQLLTQLYGYNYKENLLPIPQYQS